MKKFIITLISVFLSGAIFSQTIYNIAADSVRLANDSTNTELNVENATRNVPGFLYNKGNGRTEFRRSLISIGTNKYLLGADTLDLSGISSNSWLITGNAETTAANFIGTTNTHNLFFRVNNIFSGVINDSSGNTAMGAYSFQSNTSGTLNTGFGSNALQNNTSGSYNAALGKFALSANTTGLYNAAVGSSALQNSTTGSGNTATGLSALKSNTTGSDNSAFGDSSLFNNTTGNYNIGLGVRSGYGTNASNTMYISDSTNHLYYKIDSAAGSAPSLIGKDQGGYWHVYKTIAATTDSTFAKNDLSFTGNRSHNANQYSLQINYSPKISLISDTFVLKSKSDAVRSDVSISIGTYLADTSTRSGVLLQFGADSSTTYSDAINGTDAGAPSGSDYILEGTSHIGIDRRYTFDSTKYFIGTYVGTIAYLRVTITPKVLNQPVLHDKYLNTYTNLSPSGTSYYSFSTNGNPASTGQRFTIIYTNQQKKPLNVSRGFSHIVASPDSSGTPHNMLYMDADTMKIAPYSATAGGSTGKVYSSWGLNNVNDSTLRADSVALKNVFYNKTQTDSIAALKAPFTHTHDASSIISGILSPARLGTGTANSTTVLYGDGTYKTVPSGGTVTTFSSGNLSPLFSTSVATATTTPALSFGLSNASAHTFFGNNTASAIAPGYVSITPGDLPDLSSIYQLSLSGTGFIKASGTTISYDNSVYITGNQTISFAPTGDVTGTITGTTSLAPVFSIGTNKVLNSMLAQMPSLTIKGNNTGAAGNASDLTVSQVNAMLPVFNSTSNGVVPLSGGSSRKVLHADGIWRDTTAVPTQIITTVQENGTALTARPTLNFNYGITGSDNSGASRTDVDVSLTSGEVFLASDVNMTTAGTFYDGSSSSLTAGTWLIMSTATIESSVNNAMRITGKIWDGTTVYAATETSAAAMGASTKGYANVGMSTIITLTGSATIKASYASTLSSCTLKATPADNNAGTTGKASSIKAVRIK